jgi:hypothetical protein
MHCMARPNSLGIVPDHLVRSHTVRLHRSDCPEHQKPPVISLVQKAGIKIAGHLSPRSRKGYTSLSFFWPAKAKSSARSHSHSTQKGKVKFTFNVAKCDKIFDELLKHGNIKLSHIIPPVKELKGRVYCKWHGFFLHNTNDHVDFHRQIQSAINKDRLRF